jgi:hypothetical protein
MTRKKPKATTGPFSALVLRALKQEVNQKAGDLIEKVLKPKPVELPPTGHQLNYVTAIRIKWLGSKCYFISVYACPGPNSLSPSFERKFARMQYVSDGKFNLAFMRHTGQWVELYEGLSVDECMKASRDGPWFVP